MDLDALLSGIGYSSSPIGLGGCRVLGPCSFEPCAHDLVIFDGDTSGKNDRILACGKDLVTVRHASLLESDSGLLLQFDRMRVLRDESWDLRSLLRWIESKRDVLYRDLARNSLLQSMFYCQRAYGRGACGPDGSLSATHDAQMGRNDSTGKGGMRDTGYHDAHNHTHDDGMRDGICDPFSYCWQKCASFFLADALCALNQKRPGPSHVLDTLRTLPKRALNEHVSVVTDTVGLERATPTLLARMASSTAGFASHICGKTGDRDGLALGRRTAGMDAGGIYDLVMRKHDYFLSGSLLADCYFYLGYANKTNVAAMHDTLRKTPDLIHMLKVGMDTGTDLTALGRHTDMVQDSCHVLLDLLSAR